MIAFFKSRQSNCVGMNYFGKKALLEYHRHGLSILLGRNERESCIDYYGLLVQKHVYELSFLPSSAQIPDPVL